MVALLHQLEEDIGLLRFQIQVPKFVDQKDVQTRQAVEQLRVERSASEAYISSNRSWARMNWQR